MRTVTYGGACSLDGFIAGPDGALDWLHFSRDVEEVTATYWKDVDTILMGRKTWDISVAMADAGESPPLDPGAIHSYVFSRTLERIERPGVTLVSTDPGEFVRDLKTRPGKGICVLGGGELAASLLDAGVVDEVGFNIHPILLGRGIPAIAPTNVPVRLELKDSRVIDGGCVLANYRVARGG